MPELSYPTRYVAIYICAVFADFRRAAEKRRLLANWMQIIKFRTAQYFGSHRGNSWLSKRLTKDAEHISTEESLGSDIQS